MQIKQIKASLQISFLRKNLVIQKDLQLEVFKKYFKNSFLKGNKLLFQITFFEEFCKVITLSLRMSDAVSLHLIFICLRYTLFPVQSNSRYLLVFAKQSWIMDVILYLHAWIWTANAAFLLASLKHN